jgi:hypothetical protein
MKTNFFKKLIACTIAAIMTAGLVPFSVNAAPARVIEGVRDLRNSGNADRINGYDWEFWSDGGTGIMTIQPTGAFSATWDGTSANFGSGRNLLFRVGRRFGTPGGVTQNHTEVGEIVITYSDVSTQINNNNFLCIYGWTVARAGNPMVEWYIIDSWGDYAKGRAGQLTCLNRDCGREHHITLPSAFNATTMCERFRVTQYMVDGGTYDLFVSHERRNQPSIIGPATFPQYIAIRTTRNRNNTTGISNGTVSVSEHFRQWEANGLNMRGPLYEVMLCIEAWGSAGSATVGAFTLDITQQPPKADPVVTFPASATITFGQTLANAVLSGESGDGTFAFVNPAATPNVSQSGNSFPMIFTPTNTTEFNTVTRNVAVTVNQATATAITTVIPATVTRTAFEAREATTTAQIATLAGLPSTVAVSLAGGGTANLPITWNTSTAFNSRGANYSFTGTVAGNANITANNLTASATVNVTPVSATVPSFENTYLIVGNNVATVLPASGNINVQGVSVPYTINWNGGEILDTATVGATQTLSGTVNFTLPAWLSAPANATVSRFVTVTDRTQITINANAANTVYTGRQYAGLTGVSVSGGTFNANNLELSFYSRATTTPAALSFVPTNAGEYTVVVSVPENDPLYFGTRSFDFAISRAPLTLAANNLSVTVGGVLPNLTFTVSGMVNNQTASAALATNPTLESPTADMDTVGTYAIELSGGTATANYYIATRRNGTLTVNRVITNNGGNQGGGGFVGGGGAVRPAASPAPTTPTTTQPPVTQPPVITTTPGEGLTYTNVSVANVSANAPQNISVPIEIDEDINHHRIVAIAEDGTIIGGNYNTETGLFEFETAFTGDFSISYVEDLNRLVVQIGSNLITDRAGNAPTQTMDVVPVIQEGRTLLPLRFMAYALGADVGWNETTREVSITLDGRVLVVPIGTITPELAALGMDVPPQIIDGRTMVPLRFISEFFGAVVTWDENTQSIEVIF